MKGLNYIMILILFYSCRKSYNPPSIGSAGSYLVVEGVINSGSDSTVIKLSRVVNLSNQSTYNPVNAATVVVESDQNASYPLAQTVPGTYSCAGLNLDNSHKYRLSVNTGSEQYLSDYEGVLNSPPIDSLWYSIASNGLSVNINTHDATNTVKYYRWDYQETWIYTSPLYSAYYDPGDTVLLRTPQQQVFECWPGDASSNVIINSTARLSNSVISNYPVTFVQSASEKLAHEYSIIVHEYALTGDAYNFWQNMKTNTEELGTIFDPQPSQVNGNIHSVSNPDEPVIGYISVGSVASQRIFVYNRQLPAWLPTPPFPPCGLDSLYYKFKAAPGDTINEVDLVLNYSPGVSPELIPVTAIGGITGITGFSASTPVCTECTLQGPNTPPPFGSEMKKLIGILSVSVLLLAYEGCRKPGSYLVVEGVIDPGPDSTIITLSQTVNLSASVTLSPVTGATVAVLSDQNTAYPLTDEGNGNYISPDLNLDQTHQ